MAAVAALGLTVAGSKMTSGTETWQRIAIGGTAAAGTSTVTLTASISQAGGHDISPNRFRNARMHLARESLIACRSSCTESV